MNTIRSDLKNGTLRRFYALTGTEDYLRRLYLGKLSSAIIPEENSLNLTVYDGNKTDPIEVVDAAMSPPFLGERRLIILSDTGFLKSSSIIADRIEQFPETTYMLFFEKDCDQRNKLYKYIEKEGHVAVFEAMRETDTVAFIANRLQRFGMRISDADARLLLEQSGNDLTGLSNEIDKIAAYCDGRDVVTASDIREMTSVLSQGQMFRMIDAMTQGRKDEAFRLLHYLLQDGASEISLLAMMTDQLEIMLTACEMKDEGRRLQEIQKTLAGGYLGRNKRISEYRTKRALESGSRLGTEKLRAALGNGYQVEKNIKTGLMPGRLALEYFIGSM